MFIIFFSQLAYGVVYKHLLILEKKQKYNVNIFDLQEGYASVFDQ